jgi:linoleoyl-CoA desaturase
MLRSRFLVPALPSVPARERQPAPAAVDAPRPKFPKDEAGFLTALRGRADAYFAATGRRERDNWQMYLKTAVILAWLAASYALLVFAAPSWWLAVPLAVALAAGIATVGLSIQHDGGHHAYSRRGWVNRLAAMSLDLIGASSYLWRWKHGVFHHTYPNVDGQDTDIDIGSVARFSPHQRRRWFHRWQHLYMWPLYSLTAPLWHLYGDFKEVAVGRIGPHRVPRPRGWDLVVFVLGKVVSVGLLLAVPMLFHPWWVVLAFYALVTGVAGLGLTVVFQLAHCVGEADYPVPAGGQMGDAWAVHQVQTTVDFARRSRVLCWLLGGLNFQVAHHLFPRVCHVHYPALSRIVEEACREFGVRYTAHRSLLAGIASHYRWLRALGRPAVAGPAGTHAAPEGVS